jgi:hypothetical protein
MDQHYPVFYRDSKYTQGRPLNQRESIYTLIGREHSEGYLALEAKCIPEHTTGVIPTSPRRSQALGSFEMPQDRVPRNTFEPLLLKR